MKALVGIGRTPVEIRDGQGATPLYVAASTDQQQICLYLMSKGANVEVLTHWNARRPSLSADLCTALGSEALKIQTSDCSCTKQAASLSQARLHNPQAPQRF